METIKDTINQGIETVQGKSSEAEAKGRKEQAKGNTADDSLSNRASGAADYVGAKTEQKTHEAKSNAYDAKKDAE